jgi:hypothetical protein
MSSDLGNVTNQAIRDCLGTRVQTRCGLAIHGTNKENVLTTAAAAHLVGGVFKSPFATASEINISALAVLNAKSGELAAAGTGKVYAARQAGDDDQTLVFVLACNGTTAYVVEPDVNVAAAQDDANYELSCPSGYAPFGVVKLVRDEADVVPFQFGNDTAADGDLNTAGRTATFFSVGVLPASVADLV